MNYDETAFDTRLHFGLMKCTIYIPVLEIEVSNFPVPEIFMIFEYVLPLIVCFSAPQTATTESGEKVLLYDNGTWRKVTKDDRGTSPVSSTDNLTPDTATAEKSRITLVDIIKNSEEDDFRKVRWGMSISDVKTRESAKLLKENLNQLEYEADFLGYTCKVVYYFITSRLQRAELLISQDHTDPARYYKDYENLIRYLNPIYGTPLSDVRNWKNEMYKNDRSRWGFAISIGFLTCKTVWNNKRSQVSLNISGGNHKIKTNLEYISVE
ncbi:MAG: hypothetical protein JW915_24920 [Chitinispirillaceae bacterium]|nr:hypothetical protein [Chitinispirillaceae bacterium]